MISGDAHLLGADGRVVGGGRAPLGRSVDASFAGSLRAGRLPGGPGEVVIDRRTARDQRLGVGDRVGVVASGGEVRTVAVSGVLDSPEIPDAVVLVGYDPATARRELAPEPGRVSHLEVHAAAGVGAEQLRDRLAAALGPGYQAFTGAELAAERARNATPDEGGDSQFFLVAGVVALLAGMFLIRNTFAIVLASRARELALLRCLGASRAQLRRSVLVQSSIVGALASLAGLVAGIGLGAGFGVLLRSTDEAVADVTGATRVEPRTVAVALVVGVGTALVSAWGPARRAGRVPPLPALRGEALAAGRVGRGRTLAGAALAARRRRPGAHRRPRRPGREHPAAGRDGRRRPRRAGPRPRPRLVAGPPARGAGPPGRGGGGPARRRQRRPPPPSHRRDRAAAGHRARAGRVPGHPGRQHQGVGGGRARPHPPGRLPARGGRGRHAPAPAEPAGGRAPGRPARAGRGGRLR